MPNPPGETPGSEIGIGWRHPHYAELLEQRPPLSFLEVHSENFFAAGGAALAVLERGRQHYPVSLHGVGLSLGSAAGLDGWHLDQLERLVERIEPVRVSDHASFARGLYKNAIVHGADLLPIPFNGEALNVLCANVHQVQDRLRRRFMVENLSAYFAWPMQPGERLLDEPEFLNALAGRTGCALLVDVNNIYVNALNAQSAGQVGDPVQRCCQWLDRIKADAVGEIHLAGHCHVSDPQGEIVIDDHGSPVCNEVWLIYEHAVERFGAVPTLIEWDRDIPELKELLSEASHARRLTERVLELST